MRVLVRYILCAVHDTVSGVRKSKGDNIAKTSL